MKFNVILCMLLRHGFQKMGRVAKKPLDFANKDTTPFPAAMTHAL